MSEATSGAGADTTPAAPAASAAPISDTLLTGDGQGQNPGTTGEGASPADGEGSKQADGASEGGSKAPEGAPEAYEDFKAPDGVVLDAKVVEEFKGLAKELGLSQEKAQQVADLVAKQTQAAAATQMAEIQRVHADWAAQTKADPQLGGEKLDENLAAARVAMEATTTPQLRALLAGTGLGNHPEVIRHFLQISPAFTQSTHVPGGTRPAGSGKTAAQVLYDTTT